VVCLATAVGMMALQVQAAPLAKAERAAECSMPCVYVCVCGGGGGGGEPPCWSSHQGDTLVSTCAGRWQAMEGSCAICVCLGARVCVCPVYGCFWR